MLTLAAYRVETPSLDEEERYTCWTSLREIVDNWLCRKGVDDTSSETGQFTSETRGAQGTFSRSFISNSVGALFEISLTEPTENGNTFITSVAIANADRMVFVYLTLSASISGKSIAPIVVYPRCPVLMRNILTLRNDWMYGGSKVPGPLPISLNRESEALNLVHDLMDANRTLPVTVVSELEGEPIWNELPEKLAIDLAGLSPVVRVSGEVSWALNNLLGKARSCYLGAIRIYWPLGRTVQDASDLRSKVWTAERLLSHDSDGKGISRFTTALRRQVMSIAALAVDIPTSVRRIKNEQSRARFAQLQQTADANAQDLELMTFLIAENDSLKEQLEKIKDEAARQASRAEVAEHALELLKSGEVNDEPSDVMNESTPKAGEVRYYKKTHSKPSYDVLVRISDCGHKSWRSANKGDKAKKGIEKIEGRSNWKTVFHCGACQGGGVWKVIW